MKTESKPIPKSIYFIKKTKHDILNSIVTFGLLSAASLTVISIIIIAYSLISESYSFFTQVSLYEFFFGTQWSAFFDNKAFGTLPLLAGTMLSSAVALGIAIPIGLGASIFLSEYSSIGLRKIIKPIIEILAAVPTVVYGYFALYFITPNLRYFIPEIYTYNAFSAGIAMGVMIIPTITSLTEDAFHLVPSSLKIGGYALGARKSTVILRLVIPYSLSAILSIIILAIGRAIGETMIVSIAAGLKPTLTINPFESIMTMTSAITQAATGDAPHGTLEYTSLFAIALYLFAIVIILNLASYYIKKRWEIRHE